MSLSYPGDTTFNLIGATCPCIDFGKEVVIIVFGVAPKLAAKKILDTAFNDNTVKITELERRHFVSGIGRLVPIFASITDATVAHNGFAEIKKDKEQAI